MLGGALLVVGVATLLRSVFFKDVIAERYAMHLYRRHIIAAVLTGAVTGFVIGLTSAGSGTLIAIALIAIFRLTPQRVVGTDIFHAAVLLWAAGIAHWVGGNVDFVLAGNILLGSVPGVLLGGMLAVRAPQGFLRRALAVVLLASGAMLVVKEGAPERRDPGDPRRLADRRLALRRPGDLAAAAQAQGRGRRARAPT